MNKAPLGHCGSWAGWKDQGEVLGFFVFVVQGIESKASHMLGKCSAFTCTPSPVLVPSKPKTSHSISIPGPLAFKVMSAGPSTLTQPLLGGLVISSMCAKIAVRYF